MDDEQIQAVLARHSIEHLDSHALGKLPASQLRLLHGELIELTRARRQNAEVEPEALARAVDAAMTTLECLEHHPEVVSAAADHVLAQVDAAPAEPAAHADPPVAASNVQQRVTRVSARFPDLRPRVRGPVANIRASGGQRVTEPDLLQLLADAATDITRRGVTGTRRVATVESNAQVTRLGGDVATNERLVASACAERVRTLRASGGICSPSSAIYDMQVLASTDRPVRDALVPFVADRGGVRLVLPPKLADVASGVATWTAANDITPSSPSTKPSVRVACGDVHETFVNAVTASVTVGNFRQQYFPEQVSAWMTALAAEHARVSEQNLLTALSIGSVNTVTDPIIGASRDVLATIDRAASAYRSRQRLAPDTILTCIMPAWLRDLIRVDLVRESFTEPSELNLPYAQLDGLFTARNISPVFSLDWDPAPAQVDGYLDGWQSTCPALMFHPSSWLFLDGGTLNIGVVRDLDLVKTNDFVSFFETMENVAFRGVESLLITMTLCPDGSTSAPIDISGTVCPQGS